MSQRSSSARYFMIILFAVLLIATSSSSGNTTGSTIGQDTNMPTVIDSTITSDVTGTSPPSSGDWIINDHTVITDMSNLLVNGSIIVSSGAYLEIDNSNLYFTTKGSNITISNGAKIDVSNSVLSGISNTSQLSIFLVWGGGDAELNATFSNSQISNYGTIVVRGYYGITTFSGVNFLNWTAEAIRIDSTATNVIDCDFNDPDESGSTYNCGDSTFSIIDIDSLEHTLIDGCTFRNLYHSASAFSHAIIFQTSTSTGAISVTNNEFYNIADADGVVGTVHCFV